MTMHTQTYKANPCTNSNTSTFFLSFTSMQEHTHTHPYADTQICTNTSHLGSASISLATVGTGGQGWSCAATADDGWEGRSPVCRAKAEICCPDTFCRRPSNSERGDWHGAVWHHERCRKNTGNVLTYGNHIGCIFMVLSVRVCWRLSFFCSVGALMVHEESVVPEVGLFNQAVQFTDSFIIYLTFATTF